MRLKVFTALMYTFSLFSSCGISEKQNNAETGSTPKLIVSKLNPHLLETIEGKPVFLNNYTVWKLLRNGSREDMKELAVWLKENKFNAMALMILDFDIIDPGKNYYGDFAFELDKNGFPNPLKPIVTDGVNPLIKGEYDFWDNIDYLVNLTDSVGLYVCLHPAWGDWFSGKYRGEPDSCIIFNELNAYQYGHWLGERYRGKQNIIWMLGGDRSAVYDLKTRWAGNEIYDYRKLYNLMAKGLADGENGVADNFEGVPDYSNLLISYHPRKWAPNSSEWFHNEPWLKVNSIQDNALDQVQSVPNDYNLKPIKPTWLYEGMYEGSITTWGIRYQAYQTVFSGAFGHTYGSEGNWRFPKNWRELIQLPGSMQMKHLYHVAREIWTDKQYLSRTPDQLLIVGDQGKTIGDGTTNHGNGGGSVNKKNNARSDRITAIRGSDGSWVMVYSANGRDITLDLSKLTGKLNAYWFNPQTGMWWVDGVEVTEMSSFRKKIKVGSGEMQFYPPGVATEGNDWVLVLRV